MGLSAFDGCSSLASVVIADGATAIGQTAFYSLPSLTNVIISSALTNMQPSAFAECSQLANVTVDDGAAIIGDNAFQYCTNLTSITIPGSVVRVGQYAFNGCANLAAVTLGTGITTISNDAFDFCPKLASIEIPGTVTNMGSTAFGGCTNLSSVTFDYGATTIGSAAFDNDTHLTNVTLPDTILNIGNNAFQYCDALTNIVIPASVTNINNGLAQNGLISVFFLGNAPAATPINGFLADNVTAYYLPGTTGWTNGWATYLYIPVVQWNALIPGGGSTFGVKGGQFGFTITGAPNLPIVLEASASLTGSPWTPVATFTLTNGSYYYSEPLQTSAPGRFYRVTWP